MAAPLQGLCEACAAIGLTHEDFENPPFIPEQKYHQIVRSGTLGSLRLKESECGLCKLLLHALFRTLASRPQALEDSDAVWEAEWLQNNWEYDPITDEAGDLYASAIYPQLKGDKESGYGVQLLDKGTVDRPLRARAVPSKMDMARMKAWIEKCQDEHGESCSDSYLTVDSHPSIIPGFMVIDVERRCLTELPPRAKYVALSYVWGKTNWPLTTKSNVEDFRKEGAFGLVNLAKTIRHAIEVTAGLGFGFLWVDALCIVQDDEKFKPQLIASMDAIYGNSAVTILAASGGHADAGLSGWTGDDILDRENAILDARISPDLHLGVLPCFDIELMNSPHAKRGWTYQEFTLSSRRLVFLNGINYFTCRQAVWREDFMAEIPDVEPFQGANTLGETGSEWPLRRFAEHVEAFSSRKLTYPSDKLNAFIGILKAVARSMGDTEMWFGLPAAAFDWAILWQEWQQAEPKPQNEFPSWSWAGFDGPVTMPMDHYSEFDQTWLRERTWIKWWISDGDGRVVPIWNIPIGNETSDSECNSKTDDGSGTTSDEEDETFMPQYDRPGCQEISRIDDKRLGLLIEIAQMSLEPDCGILSRTEQGIVQLRLHQDLPKEKVLMALGEPPSEVKNSLVFSSFVLRDAALVAAAPLDPAARSQTPSAMAVIVGDDIGGMIWQLQSPCLKTKQEDQDLVIVSWAAPGTLPLKQLQNLGLGAQPQYAPTKREDSRDGEDVLGEWHEWDYLNVLSVSWESLGGLYDAGNVPSHPHTCHQVPIYRRTGVGVVHKNALRDQKVVWDRIALI